MSKGTEIQLIWISDILGIFCSEFGGFVRNIFAFQETHATGLITHVLIHSAHEAAVVHQFDSILGP